MTRPSQSLDAAYFEGMFQGDDDPWDLQTSPYEAAKFEASVAALDGRSYKAAFEVGCAGGSLTARLAPWTRELLAIDISGTAVKRARRRCAPWPWVRIEQMAFPAENPAQTGFDLIVLSEVAYYWSDADLDLAARAITGKLAPGGDLLLVHWTGETDYPQTGDQAVEMLARCMGASTEVLRTERHEQYRLDLWRRR